jgi:hypothetical protein
MELAKRFPDNTADIGDSGLRMEIDHDARSQRSRAVIGRNTADSEERHRVAEVMWRNSWSVSQTDRPFSVCDENSRHPYTVNRR